MSCAPACPRCAPARTACASRFRPSTPSWPTARSTFNSPTASRTSSPTCAPRPPPPPFPNVSASCGCSSKTSSSAPTRSPSGIASRSVTARPTAAPRPTRRTADPDIANCVGGVSSPLLANIFLHYAFDAWMARTFPDVPFERYADDAVAHCRTEAQARAVLAAIRARLAEVGLDLHEAKTRIVYCKDADRRGSHEHTSFTFLGYTFRPRLSKSRFGHHFVNFSPAVSKEACVRMRREIRRWRLHERSDKTLTDLARMFNTVIQGWINYYGRFYKSMLYPTFRHLNEILVRWAMRKYKRLRFHTRRARKLLAGIARREPALFAHWKLGVRPDSWRMVGAG